jgi:hypothetical protein
MQHPFSKFISIKSRFSEGVSQKCGIQEGIFRPRKNRTSGDALFAAILGTHMRWVSFLGI